MTERNETIPTAAQRVSEFLRRVRAQTAGDQGAVAECFTALGLPTNPSTITRIESGRQGANVEQLLLLALFDGGRGLRDILQVPFRIADVIIETEFDRDSLLGYHGGDQRTPDPTAEQLESTKTGSYGPDGVLAKSWRRASNLIDGTLIDRRHRQIADELAVTVSDVEKATRELYGGGVYHEINERTRDRLSKDDPQPELGSATWQAYRSHAVRAVTREIAEHVRGRA